MRVAIVLLCVLGILLVACSPQADILGNMTPGSAVDSFEKCALAGFPIMESYPRQCKNALGEVFTEEIDDIPEPKNCVDSCGNGICEVFVCEGLDCPCAETTESCPLDCDGYDGGTVGDPFCGFATDAECSTDDDCTIGGCSGQVCQGVSEEGKVTTCEFKGCYDASQYGLSCGCVKNRCAWAKR